MESFRAACAVKAPAAARRLGPSGVDWEKRMSAIQRDVPLRCGVLLLVLAGLGGASAAWAQERPAAPGGAGVRAYGCDVHDPADADGGAAAAISILGARNGTFSGKVVAAGGAVPKAIISDL